MYVREEDPSVRSYYTAYARPYDTLPPEFERLLALLEEKTGLPRDASLFPTVPEALAAAAMAMQSTAREVFSFSLELDDPDAGRLDAFCNTHLIDARVRDLFQGPVYDEEAPEERHAAYAGLREQLRIPASPLLYFALGAFWGEWLIRHARAAWFLLPPLEPVQSFPDFLHQNTLLIGLPFSQVVKKLAEPEGELLAAKARYAQNRHIFPPVALAASIADAEKIHATVVTACVGLARERIAQGDTAAAFSLLAASVEKDPQNGHLLHEVASLGRRHGQLPLAHRCACLEVDLAPQDPRVLHDYAGIEALRSGGADNAIAALEKALELDPAYESARMALADCLARAGRKEEAAAHARHVARSDRELAAQAKELLKRL